ncbi:c-type cytochrome [Rehaibacterium terrae]|jgi:mono/diheme cytochrome c family protein|uniref:Mono/diheme cytochrome c family protein n=1 Tax=Rehaibacterium terrae TaxID=1341696 RepID=A0A7W7XYB7_9GAMM|nr:cytochrome c [Rehaibacterium terrae]MBB5014257.1 mono/diheme cytochrome c family protein [Rehaibacterium terrae]
MRERWARTLAITTGLMVLALSVAFATIQNPGADALPVTGHAAKSAGDDTELLARGRAVYDAQGCARCHSIAGQGSPRSPLDGVGARIPRELLGDWVVGSEAVADELAPRVLAAKRPYAKMPAEDLAALVAYLASLDGGE